MATPLQAETERDKEQRLKGLRTKAKATAETAARAIQERGWSTIPDSIPEWESDEVKMLEENELIILVATGVCCHQEREELSEMRERLKRLTQAQKDQREETQAQLLQFHTEFQRKLIRCYTLERSLIEKMPNGQAV